MAVPEQVRKQSEEIQKLYDDLNTNSGEVPEGAPTLEVVDDTATSDSTYEQVPELTSDEHTGVDSQDEETFKHKYLTLQGMYNAEVPGLQAQNKDLVMRVGQLEQLLSSIAPVRGAASSTPTPGQPLAELITAEDIEEYGESIDIMRKAAKEEVSPYQQRVANLEKFVQQMQANVMPRMDALQNSHQQTTEQRFWSDLSNKIPNWQRINDNPDFQTWLLQVDDLTGVTRQSHLDNARDHLDLDRVIKFFTTWPGLDSIKPDAQPNRGESPSELEAQIAPGKGRSAPRTPSTGKKTYTQPQIAEFYEKVREGKFKGKEDERNRIEADIFAAQAEGRITIA